MSNARSSSLRDYVQVLRRRKWIIIPIVVLLPAAAITLSLRQHASYRATAQVLLNRQDLSSALQGAPDTSSSQDPGRYASTQAGLARVPAVANAAIRNSGVSVPLKEFLSNSSVSTSPESDLLQFEVNHGTRAGAKALVNADARAYVAFRRSLDTQALTNAQKDVAARLRSLESAGDRRSALHRTLAVKADELRTLQVVQSPHAVVVRTADSASQTQPKPVRTGLLALVIGLAIGLGLAFLVEALDTRVGSAVEIAEALGLPLLARLAKPRKRSGLSMFTEPDSPAAEAFRVLRTNLDLINLDHELRSVMVASASPDEGKSTTIANLAVAAARAGKSVILVDLDLRRGDLDELFELTNRPGLSDVAVGSLMLSDALFTIDVSSNDGHEAGGSLRVLSAGRLPPSAGEVAASARIGEIISELVDRADLVLIDAPPFLNVSDAMAISAHADGLVVVTRLDVRRPMIGEMRHALEQFHCRPLGVVVTGDEIDQTRYGRTRVSLPHSGGIRDAVG